MAVVLGQLRLTSGTGRSLNYLKDEISNLTRKYFNNTSMSPNYGQNILESLSTIMDLHMNGCNKSAVFVNGEMSFKIHTIQK